MPYEDLTGWKRQFWRWMFFGLLVVMLLNLLFHWQSYEDRKHTRETLSQRMQQDDDLRAARSRVAVDLINAVSQGRSFNKEERERIRSLWSDAKFDLIQKEFIEPLEIDDDGSRKNHTR